MLAWLSTTGRLLLGVVWLVAGASKITDLDASVRAVRAYRLLPETAAQVVGAGLPIVELLLGVLLVVGAGVRGAATVSAVLMLAFALRPVPSPSCHVKPAVLVSVWLGAVRWFAVSSSTVAENVIVNVSAPEPPGLV